MTHCTLISNLLDELCPKRTILPSLAMKGVHTSSLLETLMVQVAEAKWDEISQLAGRLGRGLGLQRWNWKRES